MLTGGILPRSNIIFETIAGLLVEFQMHRTYSGRRPSTRHPPNPPLETLRVIVLSCSKHGTAISFLVTTLPSLF